MKTQKKIKYPIIKKDKQGNEIYFENSNGYWYKSKYNKQGKEIYFEDSDGYWNRSKYDKKGNEIYFENSEGKIRK